MATKKTEATAVDPEAFVAEVPDQRRREDAQRLLDLMARATGEQPKMWGPSIIGFGTFTYRNRSGESDWMTVGFSPRKAATVVYLLDGLDAHADDLKALGPHEKGKGCLYVKRLDDVDLDVLERMVRQAYTELTTP